MVLVAPIEVRTERTVAHLHSVVVRPVDGDGVLVPPGEDAGVLVVPPLSLRSERVPEVVCILTNQVVFRVILLLVSGDKWGESVIDLSSRPESLPSPKHAPCSEISSYRLPAYAQYGIARL